MALTKLNFNGNQTALVASNIPTLTASSMPAGSLLQTIQAEFKTESYQNTANQWLDVSGFEGTITPSSASNKILINLNLGRFGHYSTAVKVLKKIGSGSYADIGALGDSSDSSIRVWGTGGTTASSHPIAWSGSHVDTANSTSALTYKVQVQTYSTGYYAQINRSVTINNNASYASRGYSNMILQEIKA